MLLERKGMSIEGEVKIPEKEPSIEEEKIEEEKINDENSEKHYSDLKSAILKGHNVFLTGPGGTGKSYLIRRLVKELSTNAYYQNIALTATTGVAAENIQGCTLHSWAGIGIGNRSYDYYTTRLQKDENKRESWTKCNLLIIDEISMMGKKLFLLLDHIGKALRRSARPFGGIQLIFCGDMCQLPPVEDEYCFTSGLFDQCRFYFIKLTHPWRFVSDLEYFQLLLRVRLGEQTPEDIARLETRKCSMFQNMGNEEGALRPTRLFSRKMDVQEMNIEELNKLPDQEYHYQSHDSFVQKNNKIKINPEYYEQLMDNQHHRLTRLKKGAQVMLTRNISIERGLINGSRGVVLECHDSTVMVKFRKCEYLVTPSTVEYEDEHCKYRRVLMPLILAWSMTIHKSQSATLDYVIADLGTSLFMKNMGYVVLSRCRSLDSIFLNNLLPERIECDPLAKEFEKKIDRQLEKQKIS